MASRIESHTGDNCDSILTTHDQKLQDHSMQYACTWHKTLAGSQLCRLCAALSAGAAEGQWRTLMCCLKASFRYVPMSFRILHAHRECCLSPLLDPGLTSMGKR